MLMPVRTDDGTLPREPRWTWLWITLWVGFFVMMLMGGLSATSKGQQGWVILGTAVGGIVGAMAISAWSHRRRRAAVEAWLGARGFTVLDATQRAGRAMYQPRRGERGLKETMAAVAQRGLEVTAVEFQYKTGSGKHTAVHRLTEVSMEVRRGGPTIGLRPANWRTRAAAKMTGRPTFKTGDEAFDKRLLAEGEDESAAVAGLTPELRAVLVRGDGKEEWEFRGDRWCVRRREVARAALLEGMLKRLGEVAAAGNAV